MILKIIAINISNWVIILITLFGFDFKLVTVRMSGFRIRQLYAKIPYFFFENM